MTVAHVNQIATAVPPVDVHGAFVGIGRRFLAGDRPLEIGVTDMLKAGRVLDRIVEVGTELRDRDGADVLILGCASMGGYRPDIERRLGLPVVDPTQAAVVRAMGTLALGYRTAA